MSDQKYISIRLQDLVPGCSKVAGKAVMFDEIINYVQSLQRKVEFLSMKLATVNPRMDFNIEGLLAKDANDGNYNFGLKNVGTLLSINVLAIGRDCFVGGCRQVQAKEII
ncbi:hypothetical protein L2E82_21151 [Cichorium intybus]|uniref:Uncharacterized protein n=1 Tax=Cichorium intybus TaxID=13427 RepID=A0ACB9DVE1_CICIN|nr:hypothetical protein L2E82_21151 [Cichorium intybus]